MEKEIAQKAKSNPKIFWKKLTPKEKLTIIVIGFDIVALSSLSILG
jgi:hypothetical protein